LRIDDRGRGAGTLHRALGTLADHSRGRRPWCAARCEACDPCTVSQFDQKAAGSTPCADFVRAQKAAVATTRLCPRFILAWLSTGRADFARSSTARAHHLQCLCLLTAFPPSTAGGSGLVGPRARPLCCDGLVSLSLPQI
jgi:hypothetical protein